MPSILYIEDNADNRLLVRRILAAAGGFEVIEAATARDGIELARATMPDLILMDISMPGMDGLAATRLIRGIESLKNTPIVVLTALAMQGDRERATLAGCDGYISKPIDVDKLVGQLCSYVRNHDDRQPEREATNQAG